MNQLALQIDTTFYDEPQRSFKVPFEERGDEARQALYEIMAEPCPCDTCPLKAHCAAEPVCCGDYQQYVYTGISNKNHRIPSRRRFRQLFHRQDGQNARTITRDDKLEAMRLAFDKGLTNAAIATDINTSLIRTWMQAA